MACSGLNAQKFIFNKIKEENFPNLKKDIPIKVQEDYSTLNRLDLEEEAHLPHNNQNIKHKEK